MVAMTNERAVRMAKANVERYYTDIRFQAQWGKGEEVKTSARKAAVKKAALVCLADAKATLDKVTADAEAAITADYIAIMQAAKKVAHYAEVLREVTGQRNQGCERHVEYVNDCIKCHPECQSW